MRIFVIMLLSIGVISIIAQNPRAQIQAVINANKISGGQLSYEEYELIAKKIIARKPCNILVFGVGNDSTLWMNLNKGGKTLFLEDNEQWLNATQSKLPSINAHLINFGTKRRMWKSLLKCPRHACLETTKLPRELLANRWDIIFVDAPFGGTDESPGRMKSIFLAAKLAFKHKNVDIFVHDCHRDVESTYSNIFLKPANLRSTVRYLRHYYIK